MVENNRIFRVRNISIKDICAEGYKFIIPVYQRPYVWNEIQIRKLLEDIRDSCSLGKAYYVGNIYVTERRDCPGSYDVIDGQQRFTTFWLISLYFLKRGSVLKEYIQTDKKEIRLSFDIRTEVINYLSGLVNELRSSEDRNLDNEEFLKYIARGIKTIESFFDPIADPALIDKMELYIYERVLFIFNEAPAHTDLNSLFTTLGNSGIQLEQSDILKARLLNILDSEKFEYSKIWEACENMGNYFEKNVLEIFPSADRSLDQDSFSAYNPVLFSIAAENGQLTKGRIEGRTIAQILEGDADGTEEQVYKNQHSRCRSIISFNALLIHTYRIHRLKAENPTDIAFFDTKKLLEIFQDFVDLNDAEQIKSFLRLLWKVRYQLDRHVVKWRLPNTDLSESYEEHLLLTALSKQDSSFVRTNKSFSDLQMLQSVLYYNSGFTQQYWLTPYLNYLLKNGDRGNHLEVLEGIDNYMLPGSKKDTSWQLCQQINLKPASISLSQLSQNLGTKFEHYWFYKLEYLLWKNWPDRDDKMFVDYRITSRNSVEHVLSQQDEYQTILTGDMDLLHSFGNLALLSIGQNSGYSNQDMGKKSIDFSKKQTYDSLKLYHIYNSYDHDKRWDEDKIKKHADEMMELLETHYGK